MGILSNVKQYGGGAKPMSLNTGTTFDLATGVYVPGKNGQMYLNGGLSMVNSVCGRPQTYKSGIALGYATRVVHNYKSVEEIVYDSEMSIPGIQRLMDLSGQPETSFDDRVTLYDKSHLGMEELFSLAREIAHSKGKQAKELIRETPFIDEHGKAVKMWTPTIIVIDSWSFMSSSKEAALFDEVDLGDSKTNMSNMADGKMKSEFMRQIPSLCGSKGIYFVCTAHIGNNIKMDPYAPVIKDVPMMNNSDKLKNVGTQFQFLSTNMLQTRKTSLLQDDKKKCQYPYNFTSDVELQEISSIICRCKTNVSGAQINHISSQYSGLQEWLEYYVIIKGSKSDLLEGTIRQKLAIHDQEFTRQTIRGYIATDYTFRRALEILGQFVYVRNNWNLPHVHSIGYVEFAKKFNSCPRKSEMLESTGIWSFNDETPDRKYFSLIDIIDIILNSK